jgi:hypothetical protein
MDHFTDERRSGEDRRPVRDQAASPLSVQRKRHRVAPRHLLTVLALSGVVTLGFGCKSNQGTKAPATASAAPADDSWKTARSSTTGTNFDKVPPGQTISAPLGVDLP